MPEINKKLQVLLQKIDKKDVPDILNFLPLINIQAKNKVYLLFQLLAKKGLTKNHNKEKLFKELYPKESLSTIKKLNDVENKLIKGLERFLIFKTLNDNPTYQNRFLQESFENDNHVDLFLKYHNKNIDQLDTIGFVRSDYLHQRFDLQYSHDIFFENNNLPYTHDKLQDLNDTLDQLYLTEKVKIACKMLNRERAFNLKYENPFLPKIIEVIEATANRNPVLEIYYSIYKLYANIENEHFLDKIFDTAFSHQDKINTNELQNILQFGTNYCIRRINKGDSQYLEILYNKYIQLLQNKLIHDNGILDHKRLKNIITLGRRLKKYDEAKALLETYRDDVIEEQREAVYTYNMASILIEQKEYREALFQLHNVEYLDPTYNLGARSFQLIAFFELLDIDQFEYTYNAFRWYVMRHKEMTKQDKDGYMNLLKISRQLFNMTSKFKAEASSISKEDLEKVSSRIANTTPLMNKKWLLEKLEAIQQ